MSISVSDTGLGAVLKPTGSTGDSSVAAVQPIAKGDQPDFAQMLAALPNPRARAAEVPAGEPETTSQPAADAQENPERAAATETEAPQKPQVQVQVQDKAAAAAPDKAQQQTTDIGQEPEPHLRMLQTKAGETPRETATDANSTPPFAPAKPQQESRVENLRLESARGEMQANPPSSRAAGDGFVAKERQPIGSALRTPAETGGRQANRAPQPQHSSTTPSLPLAGRPEEGPTSIQNPSNGETEPFLATAAPLAASRADAPEQRVPSRPRNTQDGLPAPKSAPADPRPAVKDAALTKSMVASGVQRTAANRTLPSAQALQPSIAQATFEHSNPVSVPLPAPSAKKGGALVQKTTLPAQNIHAEGTTGLGVPESGNSNKVIPAATKSAMPAAPKAAAERPMNILVKPVAETSRAPVTLQAPPAEAPKIAATLPPQPYSSLGQNRVSGPQFAGPTSASQPVPSSDTPLPAATHKQDGQAPAPKEPRALMAPALPEGVEMRVTPQIKHQEVPRNAPAADTQISMSKPAMAPLAQKPAVQASFEKPALMTNPLLSRSKQTQHLSSVAPSVAPLPQATGQGMTPATVIIAPNQTPIPSATISTPLAPTQALATATISAPLAPTQALATGTNTLMSTEQKAKSDAALSWLSAVEGGDMVQGDTLRSSQIQPGQIQPLRAELAPQIARQLVEIIPQAAHRSVEIALSPQELGRVRMSISTDDGVLTVTILAERPDTLDLMRRHIDQLGQSFRSMGYDQITFAFGQGMEGGEQGTDDQGGDASAGPKTSADPAAPELPAPDTIDTGLRAQTTGIDIRL